MVAIPVLVVIPATDTARESARVSAESFASGSRIATGIDKAAESDLPDGVVLDTSFAAVPMGMAVPTQESFSMTATSDDRQYVVRGMVDSDQIASLTDTSEDGPRVFCDAQVGLMPICPGDPARGNAADVRGLLGVSQLSRRHLSGDGVAVAIVDTGINLAHLRQRGLSARLDPHIFWTPTPNIKPGEYPVDHGTMCAYCVSIAAPECTLLDFPLLGSTTSGGSVMDGFLSDAVQAYNVMLTMMRKPEAERPYHSLVVNNSWGMFHHSWDFPAGHPGRYADNPNHPFNLIVGSLARSGADILFAAGNCGTDCPDGRCQGVTTDVITGANSHPDVLSVAGVDINRDRVGYSSMGPGQAPLATEKPDIAAYTHFNGSDAFGVGSPDGGTSTACPVAAGCVAAVRTSLPPSMMSSADLAEAVRDSAVKPTGPAGWDNEIGFGIISPTDLANQVNPIV